MLEEVTALIEHQTAGESTVANCQGPESRAQLETLLHEESTDDLGGAQRGGCEGADFSGTGLGGGERAVPVSLMPKVQRFDDYELLAEIAHGGMGVVYKARQLSLNRCVALKMILAGQFASEAEVRRFQAEARAAATLDHRHIVGIHQIGQHEGHHYFTMPFIEGRSLAHPALARRWRAGSEAAKLMAKVARAVQYAHERGILHRDLKPANILVDIDGDPHVLDFGLARHLGDSNNSLTMDGALLGTPSFMAPEQAAGKARNPGVATDIYGLGAILYYLLTGQPPFTAASPLDTLVRVLEGEVIVPRLINPGVRRDLECVCLRCLEKSPARRYPDAGAVAEDLERVVRDEPVKARPPGLGPMVRHWVQHRPALAYRLLGLALCMVIAQVTYQRFHPVSPGDQAGIMITFGIWGALSFFCQRALNRVWWTRFVPHIWVALDVICLTVVLWLDRAVEGRDIAGPLVATFPVLIVLSGLWFRTAVVGLSTMLSIVAYGVLVICAIDPGEGLQHVNWHLIFVALLVLTGAAVAYQVHRVRALSRFFDRPVRPQ